MYRYLCAIALAVSALLATPPDISLSQSAARVEAYDFIEVTVTVVALAAGNPFIGASLTGSFSKRGAAESLKVDGFCDSPDGSVFRIRFMPSTPGDYT